MNKKLFFLSLALLSFYQNFSYAFSFGSFWAKTESETISKEYAVQEKCTVTVHNTEGSITIKSWPQNKILIEAVKKGTVEDQKNTTLSAKAAGTEASITTRVSPNQKSSTVDYTLMVPEDSTIKITQTNGPVKLRGINGPIDISLVGKGSIEVTDSTNTVSVSTAYGDIKIQQKKFDDTSSMRLKSDRGNITLFVPRETRALLYAKTGTGTIVSDHPVTFGRITSKLNKEAWEHIKKNVEGTLGGLESEAPILLDATHGNIALKEY